MPLFVSVRDPRGYNEEMYYNGGGMYRYMFRNYKKMNRPI